MGAHLLDLLPQFGLHNRPGHSNTGEVLDSTTSEGGGLPNGDLPGGQIEIPQQLSNAVGIQAM